MIPIQQLLSRIRWDHDFGDAEFSIGYYDRLLDTILVIPLGSVLDQEEGDQRLIVLDPEGVVRSVPVHRIRQVFRNGELIWQRHPPQPGSGAR